MIGSVKGNSPRERSQHEHRQGSMKGGGEQRVVKSSGQSLATEVYDLDGEVCA